MEDMDSGCCPHLAAGVYRCNLVDYLGISVESGEMEEGGRS